MQTQRIPILIFAQSGRFLAQSATQAGYTAWVADCFGDTDLLAVAERWQPLEPFAELTQASIFASLSMLTRGEQCMLLCGSGIEYCYHLLFPLPANIHLIGNTVDTIHKLKTPALFFDILEQLALTYPNTQFETPGNDFTWLKKQATGLGGTHIQYAGSGRDKVRTESYYQHFISGSSGSCLFLADGYQAHIVSINQQFLAPDRQTPFRLGRIESAWQLSKYQSSCIHDAINQLTAATALVGLNSLDFIIANNNELFILEVNPRVSASAELINNKSTLLHQHLDACLGQLPTPQNAINHTRASLFYHYATSDLIVPEDMLWPAECHDIPNCGLIIKQGEPICTSCIELADNDSAMRLHKLIEQNILKQLIIATSKTVRSGPYLGSS
tara:strand:+ start:7140 stop:8297 length:1158 start_codon:yes stop_codon:yes gene_type:complete